MQSKSQHHFLVKLNKHPFQILHTKKIIKNQPSQKRLFNSSFKNKIDFAQSVVYFYKQFHSTIPQLHASLIIIFARNSCLFYLAFSMNIKIQSKKPKQKPSEIDISSEPYDKYLLNLKHWKIKEFDTIIKTLNYFIVYKYQCLSQMKYISEKVSTFHKQICKINQTDVTDPVKVEVDPVYFQKIIQLKAKFKKLQKKGCFSGQKKIKSRLEQVQKQKRNLVNVNIIVPNSLIQSQKDQYHRNLIKELYKSFVTYYPESHTDQSLNQKIVAFLKELYTEMKKKCFYLKQKQFFSFQIEKLCQKLKNPKFLENKKLMLAGEISIKEIIMNRISVFQNYSVKRREEQEMMKILKESERKHPLLETQNNDDNYLNEQNQITEQDQNLEDQYMQFCDPDSYGQHK